MLREAVAAHGGVEVDTQGDAFFVAFARASEARRLPSGAAALAGGPIRVRMGLHTGEPSAHGRGLVGIDVHRGGADRAAATAARSSSPEATAMLGDGEAAGSREHRLKDLPAPDQLFQLGDNKFPPLARLTATNLPAPPTPLVGREQEIVEVHDGARRVRAS